MYHCAGVAGNHIYNFPIKAKGSGRYTADEIKLAIAYLEKIENP
jgi:hypothetical protein